VLRAKAAKNEDDVKHICPLQKEVYRRLIKWLSNPDELVLDPFGGIATCGVIATELGRRFKTIELKKDYFKEGCKNVKKEVEKGGFLK